MPRRAGTTAAAAGLVLAGALGVVVVRSGGGDVPRAAAAGGEAGAGRSARVGGTGTVLVMPGERPRFCSGYGWDRKTGQPKVPAPMPDCDDMFVWADDVDLDRLTGVTTKDVHGVPWTWGSAYLEGEVRDDTLHVDHHGPPRPPSREIEDAVLEEAFSVPCPAPKGGWPVGAPDKRTRFREVAVRASFTLNRYEMENPDNVVRLARRWHTHHQPVQVLVVVDPARIPADVRRATGNWVCVVRSRYTPKQVADTEDAAKKWALANRARAVPGSGLDAQAHVALYVPVLTPDVTAFVGSQPEGLVAAEPWLEPAG